MGNTSNPVNSKKESEWNGKETEIHFVKEMKNPVMDSCVDATETKKESELEDWSIEFL